MSFDHAAGVDDYTLTFTAGIVYHMWCTGRLARQCMCRQMFLKFFRIETSLLMSDIICKFRYNTLAYKSAKVAYDGSDRSGRLRELDDCGKWTTAGNGRLREMDDCENWTTARTGRLQKCEACVK